MEEDKNSDKSEDGISDLDPRKQNRADKKKRVVNREIFYAGDTIIQQGDDAFRAYYIESGRVEVSVNQEGAELKISELGPGHIFGEMALIEKGPRTATVKALDAVTLSVISNDEIETRINNIEDGAMRALIELLIARLRETTQGQVHQYKTLADFQDRVTGLVDRVDIGIDQGKRDEFRDEVNPLLDALQEVMDRYQRGG